MNYTQNERIAKVCVCQRKSVAKGLPKSEHLSTPQLRHRMQSAGLKT